MNFKLLICNNCENEKEEKNNFLFIDDKNSNDFLKNINTDISIKSLLSSSNKNNITNNNLIIIEYPYKYSNSKDNDNPKDGTTLHKQASKHKENQNDKVTYNIALPKFSHEPKFINKNNTSNNNITHEKQESKVSNSFLNCNGEEKREPDKALLFNYVKNCDKIKIKNNNERKSDESKNKNKDKDKDKDKDFDNKFTIINNIHNLIGLKVDYPCPDSDSFYTKTNNLFNTSLKNENEKIEKNKNKIEKILPIKKKTINISHAHKKLTKNSISYVPKQEKNGIKKQENKSNVNLELILKAHFNNFNTSLKCLKKRNEKIKKNILNKDDTKIKKKFVKNKKSSQNMKQALSSIDLENHSKTNRNSNLNIKSKYSENNFKCLSKNRVRCLSNAFFSDLLLNNSKFKNSLSNLTEKKKKLILSNSEFFHQKSQNDLYSSKTYTNPFSIQFTKKRKNVVICNHINP